MPTLCCAPCSTGEHADDGTGTPCPCCGASVTYDCQNVASALCLACSHRETDKGSLDLWNGYGDCPRCSAQRSLWTYEDDRPALVVIVDGEGNVNHYREDRS